MAQKQIDLAKLEPLFNYKPVSPRDFLGAGFISDISDDEEENVPPTTRSWMNCQAGPSTAAGQAAQAPPPPPAPQPVPRPLALIWNVLEPAFWVGAKEVRALENSFYPDFLVTVAMNQKKSAFMVGVKQILSDGRDGGILELSNKESTVTAGHLPTAASMAETDRPIYRFPATSQPTPKWALRKEYFWNSNSTGEDFIMRACSGKLMIRPWCSDSGYPRVLILHQKKNGGELIQTSPLGAVALSKALIVAGEECRVFNISHSMEAILDLSRHPLFNING